MDKPQPEYFFKLTGSSYIEKELDMEKTYSITFKSVDLHNKNIKPGQGEADKIIFSGKSTGPVLMTDGEKMIEGTKKKGSQSQKMRFDIMDNWNQEFAGLENDTEKFYNMMIGLLRYKLKRGDFNKEMLNLLNQTIK